MEGDLDSAGKEVLVELVKFAQKQQMVGENGGWKDFLKIHDKQLGSSLSDPSRRSPDVLLAFLKTFKGESDLKAFAKLMKCHSNREFAKQLLASKNAESPEQKLVRLTFEHPLYPMEYSFPSHGEDWVISKISHRIKDGKTNKLLAVDCEMVLCEDGSEALVKICVVDRHLKVKLHEFVSPGKKVLDYRTGITGITEEDLSKATTSLTDIQNTMKKLLSHGAILIGHSLSNDLKVDSVFSDLCNDMEQLINLNDDNLLASQDKGMVRPPLPSNLLHTLLVTCYKQDLLALKIDHARVIDTSYIFKYGSETFKRKPSLNNLCKSVLGHEIREKDAPHNCLDDASAAMRLVLAKMERGFDDVLPAVEDNVPEGEMTKLLIHRIPISLPVEGLNSIVDGEFTVEVQKNKKGKGERYSAIAIFKTQGEALQAFDKVKGDEVEDSFGHPQKSIPLTLASGETDTIYVRKMTRGSPPTPASTKKRPCPSEEAPTEPKILKTDQATDVSNGIASVDHVAEIERLKRVVEEKDNEISKLHKLVVALTSRQFL